MASFRKLKTGWKATVSKRDTMGKLKQTSKTGFRTQALAKMWARKMEQKVAEGLNIGCDVIFADYFDSWFETYKKPKLSYATASRYKNISNVLHKNFGKRKITTITHIEYQRFINLHGHNHAKDSVYKLHRIVKTCVENAVYDGLLTKNFANHITVTFNAGRSVKVEYLSLDNIKQLISFAANKRDIHYTSYYMILTAIYTGMRLSEIQALTWKDISPIWKTITVNKSWDSRTSSFKPTKNKSSNRTIRVNRQMIDWLMELKANHSKMVFTGQYDSVPTSEAVNKLLKGLLSDLGINKLNFHFHSLRHSHVAYMLAQGVDIYAISKRLGHADLSTTTKIYAYLLDEFKAKQDDEFENKLNLLSGCCTKQEKDNSKTTKII